MSAYDNDWRVQNISTEDFGVYVVWDEDGSSGRVEHSTATTWSATWNGGKLRRFGSLDEAIHSLIGDPQ